MLRLTTATSSVVIYVNTGTAWSAKWACMTVRPAMRTRGAYRRRTGPKRICSLPKRSEVIEALSQVRCKPR